MAKEEEITVWGWVRRVIFWLVVSSVILVLLLIILAVVFEKRISKAAMEALQKHLRTELTVEETSLSLIRGFPRATLSLRGTKIKSYGTEETLLEAEALVLKCSIFDLLTGNYAFHTVELSGGNLSLYRAANGLTNYEIFAEQQGEAANMFPVARLQLRDMRVRYVDEQFWQRGAVHCTDVDLRTGKNYDAEGEENGQFYYIAGGLETDFWLCNGDSLLVGNAMELNLTANYVQDSAHFRVDNGKLNLNGSLLKMGGLVEVLEDSATHKLQGLDMDFLVLSNECKLKSLAPILPSTHAGYFEGWESGSNLYTSLSWKGRLTAAESPLFTAILGLRLGKLEHESLQGLMRDVNGEIVYTNRDEAYEEPQLRVQDFSAKVGGSALSVDYVRSGLFNPHISMVLRGAINLGAVYKFLSPDITAASGLVQLDSLRVDGFYADMLMPSQQGRVQLLGRAQLNSVALAYGGQNWNIDKGAIVFKGNSASLEGVEVLGDATRLTLTGNVGNVLPVFLAGEERAYGAKLLFNIAAQGENMALGDWQRLMERWSGAGRLLPWLGDWLSGKLHFRLSELTWGEAKLGPLLADMRLENNNLIMERLEAGWAGGKVLGKGRLGLAGARKLLLAGRLEKVEAARWLRESGNLGQGYLLPQQWSGHLTGNMVVEGQWDSLGNWEEASCKAWADLVLQEGELMRQPVMSLLGGSLRLSLLDNIKFVDIYTQFYIENRNLLMPSFYLRGDGYNISGVLRADFDKQMDMWLKFNTSSVLLGRLRANFADMEEAPRAKVAGWNNVYVGARGNASGLRPRLGPTAVRDALYKERAALGANFEELFLSRLGAVEALGDWKLGLKLNYLVELEDWADLPLFGE